ncbi:helix-turn-helix domain-containing protein [Rothia nasimurium]|uniref:helix-turn-helix domain-containing protein n=1 Tax=Rothia nasimurium TaxID=85336 RepID=UPI002DD64293|nr:helix-turn-helix domain-containing protein [Rothia nasimurium]
MHSLAGDVVGQGLLAPLREDRGGGEALLMYVWAFLEFGRSYRDAVQALYIHENTLRNKVAKFEQITGRRLNDIDACIELIWLRHDMALKGTLGIGDSA